jgi:hypothetical protein
MSTSNDWVMIELAVALLMLCGLILLVAVLHLRRRGWHRFSMRSALIALTVAAGLLGAFGVWLRYAN